MAKFRYLVNSVDEAIEFYAELGFAVQERWGSPFAILRRDDIELSVSGPGTSAAKAMPDGAKPEPGGWNRFVIPVEDISSSVKLLMSKGYRFRNDIFEGPGGRQILAEDPSGNPIELFQPDN